jgi:hypothetical protein
MEPEEVTPETTLLFLERLADRWDSPVSLYLLGGGALSLLGNIRETRDLDYTAELPATLLEKFRQVATQVAYEMHLDLEEVPISEFVPLPPNAQQRRRFVGRFGHLDVYVFDPYTIALSKIARAFESDLDDVMFLLRQNLIELVELERYFEAIRPTVAKFDIDLREFQQYFQEIRQRYLGAESGQR